MMAKLLTEPLEMAPLLRSGLDSGFPWTIIDNDPRCEKKGPGAVITTLAGLSAAGNGQEVSSYQEKGSVENCSGYCAREINCSRLASFSYCPMINLGLF